MKTIDERIAEKTTGKSYAKLTAEEHVILRPDTYIGSVRNDPRQRLVYIDGNIVTETVATPPGLERLFLEVFSNALDNVTRSRNSNVDPGKIVVYIDRNRISVENGGVPITCDLNEEGDMYVPEMIFGHMLTSSTYDEGVDKMVCGRNGYGAKLTNVYSTFFEIDIVDPSTKKHYVQVWERNKDIVHAPVITKTTTKKGSVKVTFDAEFRRFPDYGTQYDDPTIALYLRHIFDGALTAKVPIDVHLDIDGDVQTIEFAVPDVVPYMEAVFPDTRESPQPGKERMNFVTGVWTDPSDPRNIIEYALVDTPDNARAISFVNGMMTEEGGPHVENLLSVVAASVIERVAGGSSKKTTKKKTVESPKIGLDKGDVRPHLSMIVVARLVNPSFTTQTKVKLAAPKPKITVPEPTLRKLGNWELTTRLLAAIDAKNFRQTMKSDGKKKKNIKMDTGSDANWAGGPRSLECSLFITEGESALGYPRGVRERRPELNNTIGCIPLRGKFKNVRNDDPKKAKDADNKVINFLKHVIGLREGMDYSLDENFRTLRYGDVVIFTDADDDGKHITGLLINMFMVKWPSLLRRNGFLKYVRTPIIRIVSPRTKKTVHRFFTLSQYEEWKAATPNFNEYVHRYLKGLGSSTPEDVEEDCLTLNDQMVTLLYDDRADETVRLAFDKDLSDARKKWLERWAPTQGEPLMQMEPISHFINEELRVYSMASNVRNIPVFYDGLKEVQRKLIYAQLKKLKKTTKVSQFANAASEMTKYHHGDVSLSETVIKMTQKYVGSNNLPYFEDVGQFGSRQGTEDGCGKDAAAARYISVNRSWWIDYVFRKEDNDILTYMEDEGEKIEPEFFYPIIPMQVINGADGIGTGFSTECPPHDPLDVIAWLEARIQDKETPVMQPWWRGFDGYVGFKTTAGKLSVVTTGTFKTTSSAGKWEVDITEVPVGVPFIKYERFFEDLVEQKAIRDFAKFHVKDKPHFVLYGVDDSKVKITEQGLRLKNTFSLNNIVFLVKDGDHWIPTRFDNIDHVMEDFYQWRLDGYVRRKLRLIENERKRLEELRMQHSFLSKVLDGTIQLMNGRQARSKTELEADLAQYGFPPELAKISISKLTKDEMEALAQKIEDAILSIEQLEATTPGAMWLADLEEFRTHYRSHYRIRG